MPLSDLLFVNVCIVNFELYKFPKPTMNNVEILSVFVLNADEEVFPSYMLLDNKSSVDNPFGDNVIAVLLPVLLL